MTTTQTIHPNASYFVQKVFVDIETVYEK